MGNVTALEMDTITEKSGHQMTGLAVSVCLTPAAPAPLPIPYPTMGTVSEGIGGECMRTKIDGAKILTVGGVMSKCHGNEPGTLGEVVSLTTANECFPIMGAPIVLIELGMAGITLSPGFMNKNPVPGGGGSASGAGGGGGGGGSATDGSASPSGPSGPGASNSGGDGSGSNKGASPPSPPAPPNAAGQASGGHPIDVVTGTLFTSPVPDFVMTGPLTVRVSRAYRSSSVEQRCGIGWGWSHALAWRGERDGAKFELVDEDGRRTTLPFPDEGSAVVLPFGRTVAREGGALVVDLGDGVQRVLQPNDDHSRSFSLAELRDRSGNRALVHWAAGEVVGVEDAVGRRAELRVDGAAGTGGTAPTLFKSWYVIATDDEGAEHVRREVTYGFDARDDLVSVVDAGGAEWTFAYDEEHYLVRERRPDGLVFHFVHVDVAGQKRCVETWAELPGRDLLAEMFGGPGYPAAKGAYHAQLGFGPGRFDSTLTDALGGVHRYIGNALGLVERYVDPLGNEKRFTYSATGAVLAMTDASGRTTRASYDAFGRIASLTQPDGTRAAIRYDESGSPIGMRGVGGSFTQRFEKGRAVERVAPNGDVFSYAYDDRGLLTEAKEPSGDAEKIAYDAHGNLLRYEGRDGSAFAYAFDLFGRPVKMTLPSGGAYELEYDSRGDLVAVTGPEGRTEHQLDGLRRVVATRHQNGGVSTYRYVGDALVERTYPDGSVFKMSYDALTRLVQIENAAGERYQLWYDAAGNRVAERTFAGHLHRHGYDRSNRRFGTVAPDESSLVIKTSADGARQTLEHSSGATEELEYDDRGLLVVARNATAVVTYDRDSVGRVVREMQTSGAWRFVVERTYGDRDQLASVRYSTGWGLTRELDDKGRLAELHLDTDRVADASSTGVDRGGEKSDRQTLGLTYDALSNEIARRDAGSGVAVETERDLLGRPVRVRVRGPGDTLVRERSYRWAKEGPLAAVEDSERGARTYELDAMGRPVRVEGLGTSEAFRYSAMGVPVPSDRPRQLGGGGRPLSNGDEAVHWDRMGRIEGRAGATPETSWRYRYDPFSRLVEATRGDGRVVRFLYDALGRLLAETCEGQTTWFAWDGQRLVEERATDGSVVRRVFDADGHTPIAEAAPGKAFDLFACDAAATPWLQIGPDGVISELELSTWGAVVHQRGRATSLRFAGQRFDAFTGLVHQHNRFYAPELGVFFTPDPLDFADSMADIVFVPNATYWIDPLGLWTAIVQAQSREGRINRTLNRGEAVVPATNAYANANNQADTRTFTHADFDNGTANLAGCDRVIVISHGSPGSIGWGQDRPILGARGINGQELGQRLTAAGFQGRGASVEVLSCNAGTEPLFGGQSVIDGVNQSTGATAFGARANNRLLGALSLTGTTRTGGGRTPGSPAVEYVSRGTMARSGPPATGAQPAWGVYHEHKRNPQTAPFHIGA